MIIWIVNPFDGLPGEPGRPGRYWTLAEVLVGRGHKVTWWSASFSHSRKTQRTLVDMPDTMFSIKLVHTRSYKNNIGVARVISHHQFGRQFYHEASRELIKHPEMRPDIIVVSMPPILPANNAIRLRNEWGGKVIVDIQDAWPETFYRLVPGKGRLHDCLAKLILDPWYRRVQHAYMNADAITAVAQTYVDLSGAKDRNKPSCVVYLGAPFEQLDDVAGMDRKSVSLFTFVYLGSMSMNYDLETVLQAAALMRQSHYDFRVVLAGMGPHEEKLKRLSRQLSLESIVEFRGYLEYDCVAKLLSESHCALNPIMPESWCAMPNKVADYFGAGLPIISSLRGELAELIRRNDAGAYYCARDPESLAAVMLQYVKNPDMAERQGKNSRIIGESKFRREITYIKLARFMENL